MSEAGQLGVRQLIEAYLKENHTPELVSIVCTYEHEDLQAYSLNCVKDTEPEPKTCTAR
jgi:hypothetical protein